MHGFIFCIFLSACSEVQKYAGALRCMAHVHKKKPKKLKKVKNVYKGLANPSGAKNESGHCDALFYLYVFSIFGILVNLVLLTGS